MQQTCHVSTNKAELPNQVSFGGKTERNQKIRRCVTIGGILALYCSITAPFFSLPLSCFFLAVTVLVPLFFLPWYSEELYVDFDRGFFAYEKSFLLNISGIRLPGTHFVSGSLADIEHIYLNVSYPDKSIRYTCSLVFHPRLEKQPFCFSESGSPLTAKQMMLLLQIATRLSVPLHDSSGWGVKWYKPMLSYKHYTILPGEVHPLMPLSAK